MALKYKIEFIILFCLADFHITASFSSSFYVLIQLIHINKKNGLCAARIRLLLFTSALFSNDDLRLILLFYLSFSCFEEKKLSFIYWSSLYTEKERRRERTRMIAGHRIDTLNCALDFSKMSICYS